MNSFLVGALIAWSAIVALLRSMSTDNLNPFAKGSLLAVLVDTYLPPLIIEGLVRGTPYLLRFGCRWIRFKTTSDMDLYVRSRTVLVIECDIASTC